MRSIALDNAFGIGFFSFPNASHVVVQATAISVRAGEISAKQQEVIKAPLGSA